MTKWIKLSVLMIVIIAGVMVFQQNSHQDVLEVHVYYHKDVIDTIDLSKDDVYTYEGDYGVFHLEVKDHRYRAIDVDCPNQICVHTGWIKEGDEQAIICAPNAITVVQETPVVRVGK